MILKNDRLLRVLRGEPVDRTPIWIMRQAGRYLPEYRKVREQAGDFLTLCKTPELACEVTLQPIDRFGLDAAIIFSDILTIPDAMGLGLHFVTGEGPQFKTPVRDAGLIDQLPIPDPQTDLRYVMDAITTTKKALAGRVPLIGFSGSPWTLAAYMVEGGSAKTFSHVRAMAYKSPLVLQQLLDKLTESITLYCRAQIEAGADVIMLFDSWGGLLSTENYQRFSLSAMQSIMTALKQTHPETPVILFTKGGAQWLPAITETACDAIGIDWTIDMAAARAAVGPQRVLQGNLDPAALYGSPESIQQAAKAVLSAAGPNHIFNLGHGIYPDVPPEHLAALVEAVQQR